MDDNKFFQKDFSEMKRKSNAEIINKRRVINGEDDGLMQVSPLKHPFAFTIYQTMLKNTWFPQEVQMAKDVETWNNPSALSPQERMVYLRTLAFASNLDGLLADNVMINIARHVTSPEVKLALVRQAYEEALHVHSYSTMVEALGLDPEEVYGLYRRDRGLYDKNKRVLQAVKKLSAPTFGTGNFENDQDFLEACTANVIMEGIYFYSAFLIFYVFRRGNKMPGSAEMIQFINRDEEMHVRLFIGIVNTIKQEQPELWSPEFQEKILQNFKDAVEMEANWGMTCIGDGVLGLTPKDLREYIQFVGDMRLQAIGLPKVWNAKNPFPWLDEITQTSMIEVNFFEGTVKEYSMGTLDWG